MKLKAFTVVLEIIYTSLLRFHFSYLIPMTHSPLYIDTFLTDPFQTDPLLTDTFLTDPLLTDMSLTDSLLTNTILVCLQDYFL